MAFSLLWDSGIMVAGLSGQNKSIILNRQPVLYRILLPVKITFIIQN